MSNPVFWALVRKEIYLMRGLMMLSVALGGLAVLLSLAGGAAFALGGILFLSVSIGSAIFMAMASVFTERKNQARLFALSLPVSGVELDRAKLLGTGIAYLVPWLLLTALVVAFFLFAPERPRGMVVYALLIQCFALALFSVVLTALFRFTTETASGVMIMSVNILFSLFMVQLNQPQISGPLRGPQIHWSPFAVVTITLELAATALAIGLALHLTARRRDHL